MALVALSPPFLKTAIFLDGNAVERVLDLRFKIQDLRFKIQDC